MLKEICNCVCWTQ